MSIRLLLGVLVAVVLLMNYRLWLDEDNGVREVRSLQSAIVDQQAVNAQLQERNQALAAEVFSLKQGLDALEERARMELGMVREGETFFWILEEPLPLAPLSQADTARAKRP